MEEGNHDLNCNIASATPAIVHVYGNEPLEDDGKEALMERMYDWGSCGRIGFLVF